MDNTVNFNLQTIDKGHHMTTYRGVKAIRCPFDYVLYQMIITKIKPDLIIEIGTHDGGGALYMSDLMMLNGGGMVHTIDIVDKVTSDLVINNKNIIRFLDGYQNYDLNNANSFNNILVIDDGSHTYDDVKNSLQIFNKLVSKNSYFIVEDGILTELGYQNYGGGPLKAIEEFLKDNTEFEIDRRMCDFFGTNATFNVNGFLFKK